jgi:hypothetical protein
MSSFRLRLLVVGLVGFLLPAGALAERTVLIEDYDPAFSYVGDGWRSYGPLAIFSGYRAHQACEKQPLGSEVANTATVTFTGKSAALVTMVAPGCGKVTWDLDGGAQTGEIDLKADTPKAQVRVPVVDGLADSEHRLALTPVGPPAKTGGDTAVSALPVNSSVWIDGLEVVTDSPPPAPTPPAAPAVKVTIDLQPKDGLVQLGETATITYRVSVLAPPQDVKIAYQVYDIDANPIASGEDEANIKPGDPVETERQITVQPPRYGHYQIRVKVTDKESGKVLAEERSGIVAMMERNLARDEGSQFGVELHPGDEDALATMAKLGLAHARVSVDWAAHEPSKGNYVYPLDKIIDAANDAELTVMAVIDGKPDWAQGTPEEFAAFARALAAHYGAKVQPPGRSGRQRRRPRSPSAASSTPPASRIGPTTALRSCRRCPWVWWMRSPCWAWDGDRPWWRSTRAGSQPSTPARPTTADCRCGSRAPARPRHRQAPGMVTPGRSRCRHASW